MNRRFFKITTTDDPVIRRLANEDKAIVYGYDLCTLMCAPRSVYSWDIIVQRVENKLFFDKRDGSQLDLLSFHETSYKRWKLDDDTYLVARCEAQSVAEVNNQRLFLTLNTLNEFEDDSASNPGLLMHINKCSSVEDFPQLRQRDASPVALVNFKSQYTIQQDELEIGFFGTIAIGMALGTLLLLARGWLVALAELVLRLTGGGDGGEGSSSMGEWLK
ncbi:Eukaryotic translation initiation factor 3 subunit D [Capsicum chinense]|nr:Eukaryotic translation initiation factor 3 subunit D [Capsicum chinense]